MSLIDLFHKGMMPISGGVLDQSNWFVDAAQFVASEDSKIRTELMK
jgi:hypothetical protein